MDITFLVHWKYVGIQLRHPNQSEGSFHELMEHWKMDANGGANLNVSNPIGSLCFGCIVTMEEFLNTTCCYAKR